MDDYEAHKLRQKLIDSALSLLEGLEADWLSQFPRGMDENGLSKVFTLKLGGPNTTPEISYVLVPHEEKYQKQQEALDALLREINRIGTN